MLDEAAEIGDEQGTAKWDGGRGPARDPAEIGARAGKSSMRDPAEDLDRDGGAADGMVIWLWMI